MLSFQTNVRQILSQRTFTDLNSLNHNPAYNLAAAPATSHSQPQTNGSITTYAPMSQSNGGPSLQRAMPPPPPSREGTLAREPGAGGRGGGHNMDTLQTRPLTGGVEGGGAHITQSPPSKKSEETNGVSLVSQQEQELFNSKVSKYKIALDFLPANEMMIIQEEEKWWWVCCLEFCFCLL